MGIKMSIISISILSFQILKQEGRLNYKFQILIIPPLTHSFITPLLHPMVLVLLKCLLNLFAHPSQS